MDPEPNSGEAFVEWCGRLTFFAAAVADFARPAEGYRGCWALSQSWATAQAGLREAIAEGRANGWVGEVDELPADEPLRLWYDAFDDADDPGDGDGDETADG